MNRQNNYSERYNPSFQLSNVPMPYLSYKNSGWISKLQNGFANFLTKLWMHCSYELQISELPGTLCQQLEAICMIEGRNINAIVLVRQSWNSFEIRENGKTTYWCLFVNKLIID